MVDMLTSGITQKSHLVGTWWVKKVTPIEVILS